MYVTNIQRFSLDDGPGIRTTVFTAGCNMRCLWCHNPENLQKKITRKIYNDDGTYVEISNSKNILLQDIIDTVIRDIKFYQKSGGGLTVSGGEPLLQIDELELLMKLSKQYGINTVVETALNYEYGKIQKIKNNVDLFIVDCKAISDDIHIRCTGQSNKVILENIKKLSDEGVSMYIRIPVIPNVNITFQEMEKIADFLKNINAKAVELLPYHKMGIGKYKDWRIPYYISEIEPPDTDYMNKCLNILKSYCNNVIWKGERKL